ncbi:MAG: hypothetical protein SVS85_01985, partial [Candidatus Nanohaloarchaea archaeon]|nr:hypothetical protein [Candidatus Nanohaloarchaea archaeon]
NRYFGPESPYNGDSLYIGDSATDVPGFLLVNNPVIIGRDEKWLHREAEKFYETEQAVNELKNVWPDYSLESVDEALEGKNIRTFDTIHEVNEALNGESQTAPA